MSLPFNINRTFIKNKLQNQWCVTLLVIIKLTNFAVAVRLRCGCSKLPFCLISSFFFANMFKIALNSLVAGETPSHSAFHQAPNYVQRSYLSLNTLKRCVAVAVGLRLFFQST